MAAYDRKTSKLIEQARPNFGPGEEPAAVVHGIYEGERLGSKALRDGVLIAMPSRVMFFGKKVGGFDLESFGYDKISSFEHSKELMGHRVTFFASGNRVAMKWISDAAQMAEFVAAVNELIANHGKSSPDPAAGAQPGTGDDGGIIGQIRQLGDLHEAGVLTDDEFASKKSELLSRL